MISDFAQLILLIINIQERQDLGKLLRKSTSSFQVQPKLRADACLSHEKTNRFPREIESFKAACQPPRKPSALYKQVNKSCRVTEILVCSDIFLLLIICCFYPLQSPISCDELLTCPTWIAELQSNSTWNQEINFPMFLLQPSFIDPSICLIFSLTTPDTKCMFSSIPSHPREGYRSKEVNLSVLETLSGPVGKRKNLEEMAMEWKVLHPQCPFSGL